MSKAKRTQGRSAARGAQGANGSAKGRGRRRKSRLTPASLRTLGRVLAIVAVVAGFFASGWVLELDRIVVERFEGRRFTVPSKVLSAPTILYPGLDWKRVDLLGTLARLGYREAPRGAGREPLLPGRYHWQGARLRVHLRAFDHPSRPEPARDVVMRLDGSVIAEIRELPSGREVGAVLLEPELVGAYYGSERQQRDLVRLAELPRHLSDAVLAVEDQRFESHHGVDFRRIAGAFIANVRAGRIRQGGSTLTQQLVKNFFLTPEQTLKRKAQEAVMAVLVEARYDKEAILESYLNEIYLGQRGATEIRGVGEASRFYFGKRASELSVADSALLAAIVQSPNRISPHRHPERARERRDLVLALMREQGRLAQAGYLEAVAEPIRVASVTPEATESRYFLDVLRRQLPEVYGDDVLSGEGLEIYSTLDPRLQRAAVRALTEGLARIEAEQSASKLSKDAQEETVEPASRLQGCLIAMRPQTGEVLALVGGRDYGRSQFDRCSQARRQVGSAFKPIVAVAALERPSDDGATTLASLLEDEPLQVETTKGLWEPQNYDKAFRGPVTLRSSIERSLNVPMARLGLAVGIDEVAETARRLGVTSRLPLVPSLSLGTAELSPVEVARAYATIANGGVRPVPHTFEDVVAPHGEERRTLDRRKLQFEQVLDRGVAFLAVSALQGVVDRGTGRRVRAMGLRGAVAGKTGTTDDEYDLWFVGFTPELVAVVWVGYDEPRSIGVQSNRGALPIWADFMLEALGPQVRGVFPRPPGVRSVEIEPSSGALAMAGCPEQRKEFFLRGTEPTAVCTWQGISDDGRPPDRRDRPGGGFLDWLFGS